MGWCSVGRVVLSATGFKIKEVSAGRCGWRREGLESSALRTGDGCRRSQKGRRRVMMAIRDGRLKTRSGMRIRYSHDGLIYASFDHHSTRPVDEVRPGKCSGSEAR